MADPFKYPCCGLWEATHAIAEGAPSLVLRATAHSKRRWREFLLAYLFILPAAAILRVFRLYPVGNAVYISLYKWGILQEGFVGLDNYAKLLGDPDFWLAWRVTIFYTTAMKTIASNSPTLVCAESRTQTERT